MEKLLKMKAELDTPFPPAVGPSEDRNQFESLTNFFRPGPARKVVVFNCDGVDFSYDDDAEEGDDIDLAVANEAIFRDVCRQAETVFGKPLGDHPADMDSVMRSAYFDEDVDEPGVSCDDYGWTPEYDGGAIFDDAFGPTRYWAFNDRYLFLQCGEHTGDNNMACFVAMTLTPAQGALCVEGYRPLIAAKLLEDDGGTVMILDEREDGPLATVQQLTVDAEHLASLSPWIGDLPDLRELSIDSSSLADLTVPLQALRKLTAISLSGNRLESSYGGKPAERCVPDLISQGLDQVEILKIVRFGDADTGVAMPLTALAGIGRWRSLKKLVLDWNNLSLTMEELDSFCAELQGLPLERLEMCGNAKLQQCWGPGDEDDYAARIEAALPKAVVTW